MSRIAADSSVQRFRRDPALLTTAILLAVRQLLADPVNPLRQSELYWTLQLEGFLIRRLNTALDGPDRGISSPIIVSVALLASYQVKHGSLEAYHIHMQGLMKLLGARGGFRQIGREDPWLERFLLWFDANSSKLAGCERYIKADETSTAPAPKADVAMYRAESLKSGS